MGIVRHRGDLADPLTLHLFLHESELWPVAEAACVLWGRDRSGRHGPAPAVRDVAAIDRIGAMEDFWLRQPRTVRVNEEQAVLVYRAKVVVAGDPTELVVASFYVHDGGAWKPAQRHVHLRGHGDVHAPGASEGNGQIPPRDALS